MSGIHQYSVVLFCHEGGGRLDLAGVHAVRPGSVVMIPGWMAHRVRFARGSRYSASMFDAESLPREWTRPMEAQRIAPAVLTCPQWERDFERWHDRPEELLPRLALQFPSEGPPASVQQALALAHEAAVQGGGAGEIAERLGYSLPHLTTQVARYTGRPLGQWISDARLDRACLLLGQGNATVAEVANRCGYADLSHFRRAFRKRTGLAPSQFKNEVQDEHF